MTDETYNGKMTESLMFRLLPMQVILAAAAAVNNITDSIIAANFLSVEAMSAVGLYTPVSMLLLAIIAALAGGCVIVCGRLMGANQTDKLQGIFALNLGVSIILALVFTALFASFGLFDLTGFLTGDMVVRPSLNMYFLGQSIGLLPMVLGNQLPVFLFMENKEAISTRATGIYIIANAVLDFFFVKIMGWDAFGLGIASSAGAWLFFGLQVWYFFTKEAHFRFNLKGIVWKELKTIVSSGIPGALTQVYQAFRGIAVNTLIGLFVGSVGVSAFAAVNNMFMLFLAVPIGMLAVSRMLMSVSIAEEDRQTLTDIMRVMFRRYVPLMTLLCIAVALCAVPLTRIFFRDPAVPVYGMTVWGMRIMPLCLPLSIICLHFICYGQASGKQVLVHILSLIDGLAGVTLFSAALLPFMGMNGVYVAYILSGIVTLVVILVYSLVREKHMPKTMDELMVIPETFGASADQRLDLSVQKREEVVRISQRVQQFCLERGIDQRRAYFSALALEEMAGNIIDHGYVKDKKKHTIDVRVVHKGNDVILRIKDDCIPFNPGERQKMANPENFAKNIGIRMVYKIASDIQYQNMMGLNVLTIRI